MNTFSKMAEEWMRTNLPIPEVPPGASAPAENPEKIPAPEPPKPPKPSSEGFAGATPDLFQKIEQPATEPEPISGGPLTTPEMERQVVSWLRAHCVRSSRAWGAEKFLHRDYVNWSEQSGQMAVSADQFTAILDETFQREGNGWQGLCLTVDWDAAKRSRTKLTTGVTQ